MSHPMTRPMGVQFEWQAGDGEGQWETIAPGSAGPRRRLPPLARRACAVLLAVVVATATGGYLILRLRYERLCREAEFQIQSVIDVEARAYARGDRELYLAQQDRSSPGWYMQQASRLEDARDPVLRGAIEDLELHGDVARVVVLEGQPLLRRMRFYRLARLGWVHTTPQLELLGEPVQERYNALTVHYYQRDRPYIDPLLEHIARVDAEVPTHLRWASWSRTLHVYFAPEARSPFLAGTDLTVSSPWLSGIPADGQWGEAYLDDLTYHVAYALAASFVRSPGDVGLSQLQRAILDEYAAWYIHQDAAYAPILGRIIGRHGTGELPEVFFTLKEARISTLFLIRWLSLHPNVDEVAFFETLLNVEREAVLAGRRDTFLLFQEQDWVERQARFYDLIRERATIQAQGLEPWQIPIHVRSVEIDSGRALVALTEAPPQMPGILFLPSAQRTAHRAAGAYAFYRLQEDWSWQRTGLSDATFWGLAAPEAQAGTPVSTFFPSPDGES